MRSAVDDVIKLLSNNRDYVILALSVLVLVEGGIIVLWARKAIRLRRRVDDAVAAAERSASAAAAAERAASEAVAQGVSARDGERKVYSVSGRTGALPPAPPAAPAERAAEQAAASLSPMPAAPTLPATPPPATAPALSAMPSASAAPAPSGATPATPPVPAAPPEEYVSPATEKAAAWVLPEPTAPAPTPAPTAPPQTGLPTGPRPVLNWSPEGTVAPTPPAVSSPAPVPSATDSGATTLGWSGSSVPVEPAADFAVISDPAAVADAAPARPVQNGSGGGNGNGHAAPDPQVWDMAMFDSNEPSFEELPSTGDILLVEDDPTIGKLYRVLLESRGYTVRQALDGLEGLDRCNEKRPDLVLLDIMMPRMNGIAFLQALRSGPMRDVRVVVLSNFMEKQLVDDAMRLGALEYMVKAQTRPEALAGALPHWLRGERAFSF